MTINTLLFDLDNTLINTHDCLKTWVYSCNREQAIIYFSHNGYQNTDNSHQTKTLFKKLAEIKKTSYSELRNQYQLFVLNNISPNKALTPLLENLQKHYKMAIVTNGNHQNQQQKIQRAELKKHFQNVIISGQIGIRKPHPDIFLHALKSIDSLPHETLFIGDSLENDILGAKQLGMETCWVNEHDLPENMNIKPNYQINNILELKKVISC